MSQKMWIGTKFMLVLLAIGLIIVVMLGRAVYAEPYEHLKSYEHPIVCKPITINNDIVMISDEKEWITLEWKDFIAIAKDSLLFRHMKQIVTVPMIGYICSQ